MQNTYLIKDWYPKFVLQKLFLTFNNKKTSNLIKTRAKDLNRYLSKEKRQSQCKKSHRRYNSNYITFWKRKNDGDGKKISGWQRVGEERVNRGTQRFSGQ